MMVSESSQEILKALLILVASVKRKLGQIYYCALVGNGCQQHGQMAKSAMIMIDMVLVQSLLMLFFCVFKEDSLWHFPQVVLASSSKFQSYFHKTKKPNLKNFNWTAISWYLQKQFGVIACLMYSSFNASCESGG